MVATLTNPFEQINRRSQQRFSNRIAQAQLSLQQQQADTRAKFAETQKTFADISLRKFEEETAEQRRQRQALESEAQELTELMKTTAPQNWNKTAYQFYLSKGRFKAAREMERNIWTAFGQLINKNQFDVAKSLLEGQLGVEVGEISKISNTEIELKKVRLGTDKDGSPIPVPAAISEGINQQGIKQLGSLEGLFDVRFNAAGELLGIKSSEERTPSPTRKTEGQRTEDLAIRAFAQRNNLTPDQVRKDSLLIERARNEFASRAAAARRAPKGRKDPKASPARIDQIEKDFLNKRDKAIDRFNAAAANIGPTGRAIKPGKPVITQDDLFNNIKRLEEERAQRFEALGEPIPPIDATNIPELEGFEPSVLEPLAPTSTDLSAEIPSVSQAKETLALQSGQTHLINPQGKLVTVPLPKKAEALKKGFRVPRIQ